MDSSIQARFWAKVDKCGPTMPHMDSCCWQWKAAGNTYGIFWYKSKNCLSHRVSYYFATQNWPDMVLHICDNKKCVNPHHLYAGNASQNAVDASNRGLLLRGEANNRTKLKYSDVITIKQELKKGVSMLSLAKKYGVSHQAVRNIVLGKAWTYVTEGERL